MGAASRGWAMTCGSEPLSSRNKHVRHVVGSCNRKDRNDGNERGDGNTICSVARSTSSTASSSEGDCSTDEAWGNGLRGTEALSCSDASEHRVPAARVVWSVKASTHLPRDATATRSNYAGRCSPFCWITARTTRLSQAARSNVWWLSVSISP